MYRVLGGLYIGSIEPIEDGIDLKKDYNITHVLSVVPGDVKLHDEEKYTHKCIEVSDEENTNILEYLNEANEFIDCALYGSSEKAEATKAHVGAVLVHCAQGVSRSVAFVMAYLMFRYRLRCEQAYHAVKRRVADAEPNKGFVEQLKMFEKMGFQVNQESELYKRYIIDQSLAVDPSGASLRDLRLMSYKQVEPQTTKIEDDSQLRCKKCGLVLALLSQVESHDPPDAASKQSKFVKTAPNSRRIISTLGASTMCSHYFLRDPLNWMRSELEDKGELEGKFNCFKCEAKVGGYSWKGSRCSCGKWMIPALHLQTAKVDCMPLNFHIRS